MRGVEFLEHTADIKFRASGKNLSEAFKNSARAMFFSMSEDKIKEKIKRKIKVQGKDLEALLYNFLEELLFLLDSEEFFLSKVNTLKIEGKENDYELEAEVSGDKAENYEIHIDVKAITYNDMFVKCDAKMKKCTAQVVLDV